MSQIGVISSQEPETCELCGKFEETRPYGPNGEKVCFDCGMKDQDSTKRGFERLVLGETGHRN